MVLQDRPICITDGCENVAKKQYKKRADGSIRYNKICASCTRKRYGISNVPPPMYKRNDDIKRRRYKVDRQRLKNCHNDIKQKALNSQGSCGNKNCLLKGLELPLIVYDFHHRDPEQKICSVAKAPSKSAMVREADKCVLLCAICHRMIHDIPSLVDC